VTHIGSYIECSGHDGPLNGPVNVGPKRGPNRLDAGCWAHRWAQIGPMRDVSDGSDVDARVYKLYGVEYGTRYGRRAICGPTMGPSMGPYMWAPKGAHMRAARVPWVSNYFPNGFQGTGYCCGCILVLTAFKCHAQGVVVFFRSSRSRCGASGDPRGVW
jgi:hypothetical protein